MSSAHSALLRLARDTFVKHGSAEPGWKRLVLEIKKSPVMIDVALREAARYLSHQVNHIGKRKIKDAAAVAATDPTAVCEIGSPNCQMKPEDWGPRQISEEQHAKVRQICVTFQHWMLMDKKTSLMEATKEQLLADAESFEKNARGQLVNAKFYRLITAKMRPGQKTKSVWSFHQLMAKLNEAENLV